MATDNTPPYTPTPVVTGPGVVMGVGPEPWALPFCSQSCHLGPVCSLLSLSYLLLWAGIFHSRLIDPWVHPVSGCCVCLSVCSLLCAVCAGVSNCVSFCLSVLCSWTLLRKERYGPFVSSVQPGPAPPQVRGSHPCPEFSLQHHSASRGRVWPFPPAIPASPILGSVIYQGLPGAIELWADSCFVKLLSSDPFLSTENHFFGSW